MQNKIWEQVGQFLNRLRCENVTRDTAVELSGYRETQEKMETLREKCETVMRQFSQEQRQLLVDWMAKLEDTNSLEGQKAYCQRYVDCIFPVKRHGVITTGFVHRRVYEMDKSVEKAHFAQKPLLQE